MGFLRQVRTRLARAATSIPASRRAVSRCPTLAAEKLAAHHGCTVSRETLGGWMIADGLWTDRRHRLPMERPGGGAATDVQPLRVQYGVGRMGAEA